MGGIQPEPEGLPQYVRDRMKPRHPLRPFIVLSMIILFSGVAWGLVRYTGLYTLIQTEEDAAAMIAEQRVRFADAFSGIGISSSSIATGFWYTYRDAEGNEHVFYFDTNALAQQNLSDTELQQLTDIVSKSEITERSNMRAVPDAELPSDLQFHNAVYSFGASGATTLDMKRALMARVAQGSATSEELFQLSYLNELEGNYAERDRLNRENCTRYKMRCEDGTTIKVTGRVVDNRGSPVAGARVEIVSRPEAPSALTNADGLYVLSTSVRKMEKLRFHALKRNYSDGYADAILVTDGVKALGVEDIAIESPINVVTIDYGTKRVTGEGNRFNADGSVVITTTQSKYEIPAGAIVTESGASYTGPVDVYLYEFTKGNPPESLMQVDTFDQVMGYAGDLMKTFGMPYIQFFTQEGVELHVLKSKPMILTYRIADMDALRANVDGIYEPLTEEDMQLLISASIGQPYRVDREFLIHNQLLRFPAFWVFDRRRGVWDNVGVNVLDVDGTIRSIFYTMRDDS